MEKNLQKSKKIEVPIISQNPMEYHLIPIMNYRRFFPGYKVPFTFMTDIGEIKVHITSAKSKEVKKGEKNAGRYIKSPKIGRKSGLLNEWFEKHKELRVGDKLVIDIKKPFERYGLDIEKNK